MQLSKMQNEYIVNATHRWNIKSGAVRSGKSFVDTAFVIPFRIRERAGKPGLNLLPQRCRIQPTQSTMHHVVCMRH